MRNRSGFFPQRNGRCAKYADTARVKFGSTCGMVPTFFNSFATVLANTFCVASLTLNPSPSGFGSGTRSILWNGTSRWQYPKDTS